jgi:hypothetical protein
LKIIIVVHMMPSDAELIEQSLIAVADSGIEIRHALFERFFATWPERRATFYNLETSGVRMTDETIQMMAGLATGESWVWPLIAELTFTHRNYGHLPVEEYDSFIDLTVEELGKAAGESWTGECEALWLKQAAELKRLIAKAKAEWTEYMPI